MKRITTVFILALCASPAFAQTTSTAQQSSNSQSVAQGTIQFSQSPADTHETVNNVSAPVEGAFASSFNTLNCGQTAQAGMAVAGFSIIGGASKDSFSCVLETAAAESTRQSTVTADPKIKASLQAAAVAIRCQISQEIFRAYKAAGLNCLGLKPESMSSREDSQPESTRIAGN